MRTLASLLVASSLSLSGCILNIAGSETEGAGEESSDSSASATGSSEGSTDASTSGDGDASTSGDGDGEGDTSASGDGDSSTNGDGDSASTGDGDGDTSTTGDGDGDGACTAEGVAVVAAINQARQGEGLPAIPLSPSMCHVAQTHSQDLADNYASMSSECNLHSWSDAGSWTACCYTPDHAEAQCMWDKPGELTNYPGNGFEISYATGAMNGGTPEDAVAAWLNSPGHAGVILNLGDWADNNWQSIGGGMVDGYWNVWFGVEADPDWP